MNLKCGIIGLPNTGKSTLFNALTSSASAEVANYPFCTIEPNLGRVPVPDSRLDKISSLIKPQNTLPTFMEFMDIAGLVKGASTGEGLGNKFLSHIREAHSILHVVRCFENENITHVYESTDPIRDIEIINLELLLADIETVEKSLAKAEKLLKGNPDLKEEHRITQDLLKHLKEEKPARDFQVELAQLQKIGIPNKEDFFKQKGLLTSKPVLYLCNLDEKSLREKNLSLVKPVEDYAGTENTLMICADLEAQMSDLSKEEKLPFLKDIGMEDPGLYPLIRKAYKKLNLITFFTAGEKEVRAWTIKKDSLAPEAGAAIHSDFQKGFIRAEVYSCQDLFKHLSEKKIKEIGLYRSEGKAYTVQDGDVIHFLSNV